ncbi:MAG: hypothetical protein ACK4TJ_03905 [Tabrizicola sp.]
MGLAGGQSPARGHRCADRAISGDPRALPFTIDIAAEGADADGLLPSVLPGEIPAYATIEDRFSQAEFPAGRAGHPGIAAPEAVRQRHRGTLLRMLERFAALWGADGLLRTPPGRRLFPDRSAMRVAGRTRR